MKLRRNSSHVPKIFPSRELPYVGNTRNLIKIKKLK